MPKLIRRRPVKFVALSVLIFFVLPVSLRAALFVFEDPIPIAYSYDIGTADMSSIGLLPPAASHPAARVLIVSVPASGQRGKFITHSWVVLKRENASSWSRYDVLGFASRDADGALNGRWLGNSPTLNRYAPDGRWFGRSPVPIADAQGTTAAAMIPKIEAVIENYETMAGHYRVWPGPNSNSFVAAVLRAAPELRASLPPTAIGKDFRPGAFVGLADSRTGVEANLWGMFGVKIGWIEGLEINLQCRRGSRPASAGSQVARLRADRFCSRPSAIRNRPRRIGPAWLAQKAKGSCCHVIDLAGSALIANRWRSKRALVAA